MIGSKKRNTQKGVFLTLLLFSCFLLFVSCSPSKSSSSEDVLSQKQTESERTQITVLVKYAFSINAFEKALEEKFPTIDLVQVGNYTSNMGIAEYDRRMEHDDLTDLVMTWPLDVGEEYWEDRLLDLSGYNFTSRYNLSMLNDISRNGKLFYLPGPSQIRGIVYNQTLFEEKGWEVPKNFEGFVELCKTIEDSGMRSLQLGFQNSEVLDTAFVGYNYGKHFSTPKDIQWISDYNLGIGSFGDHFDSALDTFQRMIEAGIFQPDDLQIHYATREKMLFTRQCAMIEDSVLMARMGYDYTGTTDKFALMPFFNPGEDNDWTRLYMVCYIGANKDLAEKENKEKYDLVMQILDYISTTEGQEALSADTGAMFSSLTETEPPNVPEIKDLVEALRHGRYAIFPQLKNAQSALREGLAGMVQGNTTKEQVIQMVDEQNLSPPVTEPPKVFGTAMKNFTLTETGSFVADVLRTFSKTDISLFLDNGKDGLYNGKGISGKIYEGDITELDIACVLPDLKQDNSGVLWTAKITGADLKKTLEYAIPVENNKTGWFYYFSGLMMEYNPFAEPGSRISKITLEDGSALDETKLYSIAVMDHSVPDEYLKECVKTETTIVSILTEEIKTKGSISPSQDKRFKIVE